MATPALDNQKQIADTLSQVSERAKQLKMTQTEGQAAAGRIKAAREAKNSGITPSDLQGTNVPNVPTLPQPSMGAKIADELAAGQDIATQQQQQLAQQAQTTKTSALDNYLKALQEKKGVAGLTSEAYAQQGGVNEVQTELNDINSKIQQEQLSLRRSIERIQKVGGGLKGGAQSEIANLERESYAKQADMAIVQMAVQGKYDSAKQIADRAVQAQLEQQSIYNDGLRFIYEEAKADWSKQDQRSFEMLMQNRERAYQQEYDTQKSIKELALTALQKGAPTSVALQAMGAKSYDQALGLVGEYMQPTAPGLDYKTVGDSLLSIDPTTGEVKVVYGKGNQQSPSDIAAQGGNIYDIISASSQYDKNLEASERQSITKALNVAGQLNTLSDLVNLDSENYGPLVGRLRGINPLDTNAQQFKALIQGIVPNLARGIYGEVGVLTDTDIENYAKTLPTLTSPEEVQDAMLGITLKLVRDSVQNQLSVAAESGVNVSGLTNTLDKLDSLVGESLAPINMKRPETQALIEAGADKNEIETLYKAGFDIEDVENYYMNGDSGGKTMSFNDAIDKSAEAIASVESGGNYQALGPVLNSGSYAGDRAYGKYQIMGNNIPTWSKEVLGYSVTPQQFLANPNIQDAIFKAKFGEAAKKYGSLDDAASVWFSGRPLAKAGNAKDQLGTSVPEYVKRFRQNYYA